MSTECVFLYSITIMANPTLTSAAATTMMKKTKICASLAYVAEAFTASLAACIFENATNNKFTALSMSSMHMKTMMALRLTKTPIIPMVNNVSENAM